MSQTTSQEQRDANTARMRRKRAAETGEQTNQRRQCNTSTHRHHHVEEHGQNRRQQNATTKRQQRAEETEDQRHHRNHQDAIACRQQRKNNPRLYNLACGFSENANINYQIPHKIDVTSSVACNHCNALKLLMESLEMCCFNGKVILAEPIAAIWVKNDTPPGVNQEHDIILRTHMNQLLRISEFSGCYDPLAYPLLFPHSEQGWAPRKIPYRNIPFPNSIDIDENPNNELIEIDKSPNNESIDIDKNPNNDRNDNKLE
ncbi:4407_t:CDS:2, partial [Gigaspora rosea]